MSKNDELLQVAKIGRLVGLRGELKLNIHCDFPEQFCPNAVFSTDKKFNLEILSYNPKKQTVSFKGYSSREDAAKLVNLNLFTTREETEKICELEDGEFFWFEIIGSFLMDEDKILGKVEDISRMGVDDYLVVKTDKNLVKKGFSKLFYVPYIDRYIVDFDKDNKVINSRDTLGILENS